MPLNLEYAKQLSFINIPNALPTSQPSVAPFVGSTFGSKIHPTAIPSACLSGVPIGE